MPLPAPTTARDAQLPSSSPSSSNVLLVCEHSLEGVLYAIGIAYLWHLEEKNVRLCSSRAAQPMLDERIVDCSDVQSEEAIQLAQRVYRGLASSVSSGCSRLRNGSCPRTCDAACVNKLAYACAADNDRMPEVVHRYARLAFALGAQTRTLTSHEHVVALDELARYTLGECERTRQFARFAKREDGSFLCVFRPKANTIPLVSYHFAKRMREDKFAMVDPIHNVAAFHERNHRSCHIIRLDSKLADELAHTNDFAIEEAYVQAMWKKFYHALALPGRDASQRGYDLRAKWVPKRFWPDLPELQA